MEWQTIDTAPKDGSTVLCWENGYAVFRMWKTNDRFKPSRSYWGDCCEWDDYDLADKSPTHWLNIIPPAATAAPPPQATVGAPALP